MYIDNEETSYLNGLVTSATLVTRPGDEETEAECIVELILTYADGAQRRITAGSCGCCGGAEWNPIDVGDMQTEHRAPARAN